MLRTKRAVPVRDFGGRIWIGLGLGEGFLAAHLAAVSPDSTRGTRETTHRVRVSTRAAGKKVVRMIHKASSVRSFDSAGMKKASSKIFGSEDLKNCDQNQERTEDSIKPSFVTSSLLGNHSTCQGGNWATFRKDLLRSKITAKGILNEQEARRNPLFAPISFRRGGPGHVGSAFAGGARVAYDPCDFLLEAGEDARIGGKLRRLMLTEEVLRLGISEFLEQQYQLCAGGYILIELALRRRIGVVKDPRRILTRQYRNAYHYQTD
ncbi:hypothetical protein B0H14DRAFT_2633953 [Mycena olivaceomarginata]|nr:hypothetical protein B0H14DRAFT_2633953 [Mycena olivaceomarginata]